MDRAQPAPEHKHTGVTAVRGNSIQRGEEEADTLALCVRDMQCVSHLGIMHFSFQKGI